jgi:hypothetical protein
MAKGAWDSWENVHMTAWTPLASHSTKHSDVPPPCEADLKKSKCYGHGSLYKLWHYLKPYSPSMLGGTSTLGEKWFLIYFVVLSWGIVAALGLGSEITIGHVLMEWIAHHESGMVMWHLAQLSFSLMLAVAFTADGGYGMPYLAIGLWKFGPHVEIYTATR